MPLIKKVIKHYKRYFVSVFFSLVTGMFAYESLQADILSVNSANTQVTVVSQQKIITHGSTFWVGFLMEMEEHWHTYWQNPGDSGYPTTIIWDLPEGLSAGETVWPNPGRITIDSLTSYGYEGVTFLLSKINVSPSIKEGTTAHLKARVNWLACRVECVPGTGEFEINLSIGLQSQANPYFDALMNAHKKAYPQGNDLGVVTAEESDGQVALHVKSDKLIHLDFFPMENGVIDNSAKQIIKGEVGGYELMLVKSPTLEGRLLKNIKGVLVYTLAEFPTEERSFVLDIPLKKQITDGVGPVPDSSNFWVMLLFAFMGGIILNLMPCVLPVLAIKVLSLIETSGKSRRRILWNGLSFTAGILSAFWFLLLFLVALKSAGYFIGWGFQFQSPSFLIFMSILFFWMGLNLLGVFEIGASFGGIENVFGRSFLLKNSFLNGVLATVVATPCTAPFMGTALGFALVQPTLTAFYVFSTLGLGLAFPFLFLTIFPQYLKFIPKPGRWMINLKRIFGVFFIASVVWLSWVLQAQKGNFSVYCLYAGLGIIGIGAWIIGKWARVSHQRLTRWQARLVGILFFLVGFGLALSGAQFADNKNTLKERQEKINWVEYSPEVLEQALSSGRPVFIDFTAKWCLSCQVNERVALYHPLVAEKFKNKNVVMIKADWTNYDTSIAQALAAYGKNSIPVYVLYSGSQEKAQFLPEILTPGIVLNALDNL